MSDAIGDACNCRTSLLVGVEVEVEVVEVEACKSPKPKSGNDVNGRLGVIFGSATDGVW